MADKKISQLDAATAPLAGSELLAVVQSGVTKKVSVDNLTAGKTVDALNLNLGVAGTAAGAFTDLVSSLSPASSGSARSDFARLTDIAGSRSLDFSVSNSGAWFQSRDKNDYSVNYPLLLNPNGGDVSVGANLVIGTAGKGIDFSADGQAAGMTSELLDDYEEGVFTATLTPSTSGSITLNSGFDTLAYTKVGRLVTVTGRVIVSSVSSPIGRFDINLPFAIGSLTEDSGHFSGMVTVENTVSANINTFATYAVSGNAIIRVFLADSTTFQSTSAEQIKASTSVWVSFSYFSA
jgi:hypothetical protein